MFVVFVCIAAFVSVAALVGGVALLVRSNEPSAAEDRLQMLTGKGPGRSGREGDGGQSELLAGALDDMPGAVETFVAKFLNLRLFIEQAGSKMEPTRFLMICGGLAVGSAVVWLLTGIYMGAAPLVGLVFGAIPFPILFFQRKRRLGAFAKQLPEALELISRALRAGHSLAAGLNLVAEEMKDPIKSEFVRVYEEQNFGIPLEDALEEMVDRVPNLDLRFFVTAIILQRQTGGDLAEILDKIGALVRERFKIWGQVQALTGEGRLSGIVLLSLPPVLAVVVYRLNPSYVMMLFEDPLGQKMLAGAVVMQILGALVIRKIVNIKV